MAAVSWTIRAALACMAVGGLYAGLPLWGVPAGAVLLSLFTDLVARRPFSSPLWGVGKIAATLATLLLLASIPLLGYWIFW